MMGTKEQFEEWLKARPANWKARIGTPCICPLALWLLDVHGEGWTVGSTTCSTRNTRRFILPDWARDFVSRIDDHPTAWVNKLKCLELLAGVR